MYDLDDSKHTNDLSKQEFIGSYEFKLAKICTALGADVECKLELKQRK